MKNENVATTGIDAPEIDFNLFLATLSRHRWVAITTGIAVLLIGAIFIFNQKPIYKSQSVVLIEQYTPTVLEETKQISENDFQTASNEFYQTQYNMISSYPVSEKASHILHITQEELLNDINHIYTKHDTAESFYKNLPETIKFKLALVGLTQPLQKDELLKKIKNQDIVRYIQSKILVEPVRGSHLVNIAVEDNNPKAAMLLSQAISDAYVTTNLEQKLDFTRSAVDWLAEQLVDLRNKLEKNDADLQNFRKNNHLMIVSSEENQAMLAEMTSILNNKLSDIFSQRLELESKLESEKHNLTSIQTSSVLSGNQNEKSPLSNLFDHRIELLQTKMDLLAKYTEQHPKVIAIEEQIKFLNQAISNEMKSLNSFHQIQLNTLKNVEEKLEKAITQIKIDALSNADKELEYERMKRDRDNNQALYDIVLKRHKEADLTQMLRVNNVKIIEKPQISSAPIRPNKQMAFSILSAIALILAIASSFAADLLDNSIKSPEQIEQRLGLSFLGILPIIKMHTKNSKDGFKIKDTYVYSHPKTTFSECSRTIRSNLLFMNPDHPPKSILITSSGPHEGKTTAAINLAITLSQSNFKVLIVDADMRRPRLHKSFQLPNTHGFSKLITEEQKIENVIQHTDIPNLDILTCGPIPPNPSELLHSERCKKLIEQLSLNYDKVIFDSPPLIAVTDSAILSSMVDGVVFVINIGKTSLSAAMLAKKRIESVHGEILGSILNNIDPDKFHSGNYYAYYRYYYGKETTSNTISKAS